MKLKESFGRATRHNKEVRKMKKYEVCVRCGKRFKTDSSQKGQCNVKCPECKKKIASKLAGKEAN